MASFEETGIDARLIRALAKRKITAPTHVQSQCIPKTLEGKDLVARARTGSGKTLAYLLPLLHRLLEASAPAGWSGLVLVPTKELCDQVCAEATVLAQNCGANVTVTALVGEEGEQLRQAASAAGALVVATPGKVAWALRVGVLRSSVLSQHLRVLVLDEADLLLSYGYEEDLALLAPQVPRSCQCLLMSATVSEDIERLQKLVLHNPQDLNLLDASGAEEAGLAEGSGSAKEIKHTYVSCATADKLLVLLAVLKLGLVKKKVLIFVNTVNTGYRVRLFLEAFGLRPAVLSAELPANTRAHILATFNRGLFDYLIATDDVYAEVQRASKRARGRTARADAKDDAKKDAEFGVTRGVDFKGVATVINFDLPSSVRGYVHRVGRTGRAGQSGLAVTLLTPEDAAFQQELQHALRRSGVVHEPGREDAAGAALAAKRRRIDALPGSQRAPVTQAVKDEGSAEEQAEDEGACEGAAGPVGERDGGGTVSAAGRDASAALAAAATGREEVSFDDSKEVLRPFSRLRHSALEALRYRAEDVARGVSARAVKEARLRELRSQLLNSARLKDYFDTHAAEATLLRHDQVLASRPTGAHLKHVPAYLRDAASATGVSSVGRKPRPQLPQKRRLLPGDPLKQVGFGKQGGRRGHLDEQLTEMERKAIEEGRKQKKKRDAAAAALPDRKKGNVRKIQKLNKAARHR